MEKRIKEANLPPNVYEEIMKEFNKFKTSKGFSAESNIIRSYIDTILDLPWNKKTEERSDLNLAEEILNRDHSGLANVKTRILEYLAVKFLKGNARGTIICLCGPPGVGKTSLGKSIAESLNREF